MRRFALLLLALAACATSRDAADTTGDGLGDAVTSPLEDVNIKREEIPVVLRALRGPYPLRDPGSCEAIAAHVRDLTAALGPDADDPAAGEDPTFGEKAGDSALDVIADTASDIIPFRGVVRYATGATRHDRMVREAYQNGIARRAYLKGLGEVRGCPPPAAPDRR
ncbi:hypothetical protein [Parvularcula dongshanensis]|uniref:Lipoprotein n=1 Tax=Parvularcula dongshanensis TaxID=1173995 RepID=A0A840I022_9PROT|nr:hypothetical protein [Parvularcula dongshanensis]MBB4657631.1 hypothetical protein [Parvularcula dongshanensis]